jgi:hypothetical protein
MNTSIFLAKFWGWYFIIFFFILSFNPHRIKQVFEDLKDQKFLTTSSFIAIIVGLLNVLFHNIWESGWKFIITTIGWISLSMGLLLFIFPKRITKWLEFINIKLVQVLYVLLFLLGVFLLNAGYKVVPY